LAMTRKIGRKKVYLPLSLGEQRATAKRGSSSAGQRSRGVWKRKEILLGQVETYRKKKFVGKKQERGWGRL